MKGILFIIFVTSVIILLTGCSKEYSEAELNLQKNIESQLIEAVPDDLVLFNSGGYSVISINQVGEETLYLNGVRPTNAIHYTYAVKSIKKVIRFEKSPLEYARASFKYNGGRIKN